RPQAARADAGYLDLTRTWEKGDRIELTLPMGLRLRRSPDDRTTVSVFYGPVLLAGELGRDGMPASDVAGNRTYSNAPAYPVPVFVTDAPDTPSAWIKADADHPLRFTATGAGIADSRPVAVRLAPLYRVHHQRFAVYWKLLTPAELPGHVAA